MFSQPKRDCGVVDQVELGYGESSGVFVKILVDLQLGWFGSGMAVEKRV